MAFDNRQTRRLLQRMGMNLEQIDNVKEVIIKTDSKELIIKNPQVSKIKNKDMDMYQVMGNDTEEIATESPDYSEDDILLVMQQAQVSKEQAIEALTDCNGDLAQAILKLTT